MPNKFDDIAAKLQSRIQSAMRDMPKIIGNEAVNFFLDNFQKQGWQGDTGLQAWQKRKRETKKTEGKPVLEQTRRLYRSIRITSIMTNAVHIGTNVPYARVHNEGLAIKQPARSETFARNRFVRGAKKGKFKKGVTKNQQGFTFKARTITMPKRQFIGNSKQLNIRLRQAARDELKKRLTGS